MTDESHEPDPNQGSPPPRPLDDEHDDPAILEGAGDFTSGEGLVAFAGMVLLAVWVIFDIIVNEYGMDNLVPVLAFVAILLPRLDRATVERVLPLPLAMKLTGWAIVLIGVVEVIIDVRFNAYEDLASILGALGAYAGYAMAFVGVRQIST
jgi:hypothetical protein